MVPLAWFGRKPPPVLWPLHTMFSTCVVVRWNASESLSAGEVLTDRLASHKGYSLPPPTDARTAEMALAAACWPRLPSTVRTVPAW